MTLLRFRWSHLEFCENVVADSLRVSHMILSYEYDHLLWWNVRWCIWYSLSLLLCITDDMHASRALVCYYYLEQRYLHIWDDADMSISPQYIASRPGLTEMLCILRIVTLLQYVMVSHYVTWWFIHIIMESSVSHGKFTSNNRPTIIEMRPTAQ